MSVEKLGRFSNHSCFDRGKAPTLQRFLQRPADGLIVVDDEYFFSRVPGGHFHSRPDKLVGTKVIIRACSPLRKESCDLCGNWSIHGAHPPTSVAQRSSREYEHRE